MAQVAILDDTYLLIHLLSSYYMLDSVLSALFCLIEFIEQHCDYCHLTSKECKA